MEHPFSSNRNEREALLLFEQLTDPNLTTVERDELLAGTTVDVRSIVLELEVAAGRADSRLSTNFPLPVDSTGVQPNRIGPYRLIEPIGHGGMGEVWRAERDDGLFEHTVAIKLLRRDIFSKASLAQFAEERRILARLRHPHIAQMFDGGVSVEGSPYIVMELIAGEAIDRWAEREQLPLSDRLALFGEAIDAVGYAHRNLTVHADLKPSNVVVEAGFGVKLLDFGIARLIDGTAIFQPSAFTHAYASPARVAGSLPIPADDIYSAGVLLNELIAGQSATDSDLRAITAKATAHDEQERYGTMAELADDLNRWQASRPVLAKPASWQRRARLFWRRHRWLLSAAAGLTIFFLIALAVGTTFWLQSERRRALANQRYGIVQRMADYIINEVDPGLAQVPGAFATREKLLQHTDTDLSALEKEGDPSPSLQREIAAGYLRMAKVYGLDMSGGIGDLAAAWSSLAHANRLVDAAARTDPGAPELINLRARAKLLEAEAVFPSPTGAGAATKSLAASTAAQGMFHQYLRLEPSDIDARLGLWAAEIVQERALYYLGRDAEGLPILQHDLKNFDMPVRTDAQRKERDFNLAATFLMLGEGYRLRDPQRALTYDGRLIDEVGRLQARGASDWELDVTRASGFQDRARLETRLSDNAAALRDHQATVSAMKQFALTDNGESRWHLWFEQSLMADTLGKLHRFKEARQFSDRSLGWLGKHVANDPAGQQHKRMFVLAVETRAAIEDAAGAKHQACFMARRAVALSEAGQGKARAPVDVESDGLLIMARTVIAKDCRPSDTSAST